MPRTHTPDNEYHDPEGAGSLVSTLRAWQALRADGREHLPQRLVFALVCPGEARAKRVAHYLRRRAACDTARVSRDAATDQDSWQVEGTTAQVVQSLADLEHLSAWLRRTAESHQVLLRRVALVGDV
jgi:hypothetical protein